MLLRWLGNSLHRQRSHKPVSSPSHRSESKQNSQRKGFMEERLIKAMITVRLKDEKADEMRQWEGLKRQKRGKETDCCAISGRFLLCVC